jgi:hypothetical protein
VDTLKSTCCLCLPDGGGFGGAVMALTNEKFGPADAEAIARVLPHAAEVLHLQSGDGAKVTGRMS